MRKATLLLVFLAVVCAFAADDREMVARHWKATGEFTVDVAEAMPADAWNFKPNPAEMSFGVLTAHYVGSGNKTVAAVTGAAGAPSAPSNTEDKAAMMQYVKASAEFWAKAMAAITPEQLEKGGERLWSSFTHIAHHRGQAEVYLRVKDIVPPKYRF